MTNLRLIVVGIFAVLLSAAAMADTTPPGQVIYGPGSGVKLTGAQPPTTSTGAVVVDTVTTKTAGHLFDVNNGGTTKSYFDFNGVLTAPGINVTGALSVPVTVKSSGSPYTVAAGDYYVQVTTGASNYTINLPACVAGNVGRTIKVKKIDTGAGAVIIAPNGTDTIEGTNANAQFAGDPSSTTSSSHGQFDYVELLCSAAGAWDVMDSYIGYAAALSSGTPSTWTATVPTGTRCVCTDATTQANPVKCAVSSTTLTATGINTNTDVITAICNF